MLLPFRFVVVVDVVTELVRESVLCELLCAGDLVLMSEMIKRFWNKFFKWKEASESKDFDVYLGKSKVMVSSNITRDGMFRSKVEQCGVCSLRV